MWVLVWVRVRFECFIRLLVGLPLRLVGMPPFGLAPKRQAERKPFPNPEQMTSAFVWVAESDPAGQPTRPAPVNPRRLADTVNLGSDISSASRELWVAVCTTVAFHGGIGLGYAGFESLIRLLVGLPLR
jgi:hypothetical protein